ncbi:class I SAM-dependent methyltransferase [Haloarchaeobius sp. DFWS5]|uniref:class I SAM-dependent methyltransferase n=1 Tax=Haloarchaeobius sp. DFWS5 TaxID=3446114 RepID=UPI003EBCF107
MTDDAGGWWEKSYTKGHTPWDLGRPQKACARLTGTGAVTGRVLSPGCGTGIHACLFAERGCDVTGVDISETAIARARERAAARDLDVTFHVGDVTDLDPTLGPFDTAVDSGAFHVFDPPERAEYVASLASVLTAGGVAHILAFGEGAPENSGPRVASRATFEESFAGPAWSLREVRETKFETQQGPVPGILATVGRTAAE